MRDREDSHGDRAARQVRHGRSLLTKNTYVKDIDCFAALIIGIVGVSMTMSFRVVLSVAGGMVVMIIREIVWMGARMCEVPLARGSASRACECGRYR